MNHKTIVFATVVAVVVVMIGSMYLMKDSNPGDDPVSEWYVVYEEVADFDAPDEIPNFEYAISEKHNPLIIEKVEKGMFTGTFDGMPIIGGINEAFMFFEICDEERGVFSYFEGYFLDNGLSLAAIDYSDEDFSEVTGGQFFMLVQKGSTSIPAVEGYDLGSVTFSNGSGVVYAPGEQPNTFSTIQISPSAIEVVSQNKMVSITQLDPGDGNPTYGLAVIIDVYGGLITGLLGYNMGDQVMTSFMSIADGKASIVAEAYSESPSGDLIFTYVDITYDVDYYAGEHWETVDIGGTWSGKVYEFDGTTLTEHPVNVIKDFSMVDKFFIHTETMTLFGGEKTFTWIGYMDGSDISVVNLYDGTSAAMIGYVDGDTMHISGYVCKDDKYGALHFELTRN